MSVQRVEPWQGSAPRPDIVFPEEIPNCDPTLALLQPWRLTATSMDGSRLIGHRQAMTQNHVPWRRCRTIDMGGSPSYFAFLALSMLWVAQPAAVGFFKHAYYPARPKITVRAVSELSTRIRKQMYSVKRLKTSHKPVTYRYGPWHSSACLRDPWPSAMYVPSL